GRRRWLILRSFGVGGSRIASLASTSPQGFPAGGADHFLRNVQASLFQPDGAKGILATHALFHLFSRFHLQVGAQLLIQLPVDLLLSEQRSEAACNVP